ncbi:endo-1,3-alpha-glucanase family glycosylhydrolase [Sorangium sp. So ce1036]|uniref:endo-1,3-alpha-glucanase family glycosylhydrolase n=1 Tax=Sorangium sp. So ce1036 TaxID=3133328 RepID=UPI003F0C3337
MQSWHIALPIALLGSSVSGCGDGELAASEVDGASRADAVLRSPGGGEPAGDSGRSEASGSPCYPFDQPSPAALRGSEKKAFAWYFPPYPVSIDNRDPSGDWYARWLSPDGGGGEYADTGGQLRDRPLFQRPPRPESLWRQLDFEVEIRQAIAMGLDGFILEMSHRKVHSDDRFNQVGKMLDAARAVDPGFRILLGPGFPKESNATPDELAETLLSYTGHPSVFRLPDGRVPIATFYPERPASSGGKPLSWWKALRSKMRARGVEIAWFPVFLSRTSRDKIPDLDAWYDEIAGYSIFDGKFVSQGASNATESQNARARGLTWVARTGFQDIRVRKGDYVELKHWEPSNSRTLRTLFDHAIGGDAPWINVVTWNDYGETQTAPSQARGYAVADLIAYYTTWFKTGAAPAITRDALYYFHRKQHTNAPYDRTRQTAGAFKIAAGPAAENNVELLAFLTEPGRLIITQGSDTRVMDVTKRGMTSFIAPIVPGTTPAFELQRDGEVIVSLTSDTRIEREVVYQDMTYYAGGSLECERPE